MSLQSRPFSSRGGRSPHGDESHVGGGCSRSPAPWAARGCSRRSGPRRAGPSGHLPLHGDKADAPQSGQPPASCPHPTRALSRAETLSISNTPFPQPNPERPRPRAEAKPRRCLWSRSTYAWVQAWADQELGPCPLRAQRMAGGGPPTARAQGRLRGQGLASVPTLVLGWRAESCSRETGWHPWPMDSGS